MTRVFITRTGAKYHAGADCPSFDDAERERERPIERWEVELRGRAQSPCTVCWPRADGDDPWRQLEHEVERTGDSNYESVFVDKVLRHIPGLRPADVSTQRKTQGRSGSTYYLDFVVYPQGGNRIAVEVDGADKAPGERSVAQVRRDVEARRADLISAGWTVLNFPNERVSTRSEECITELRAALHDAVPARPIDAPPIAPASPREVGGSSIESSTSDVPRGPGAVRRWLGPSVAALLLVVAGVATWMWMADDESPDPVTPISGECPDTAPIKGNQSQDGERIYHEPGWEYYTRTGAEECFASADDAVSAGYRPSKVK